MPPRLNPRSFKPILSIHLQHIHIRPRWSSTAATATAKQHEPLRILFCGADDFSIYSLRALHELKERRPDKIESIDVVCRPDKRVGRGLKKVQEGVWDFHFLFSIVL